MGANIVGEIVDILVSGLQSYAEGLGTGLQSLVQSMFLVVGTEGTTELSAFGTIVIVFAAISLAVSLSRVLFHFFTGLGKGAY